MDAESYRLQFTTETGITGAQSAPAGPGEGPRWTLVLSVGSSAGVTQRVAKKASRRIDEDEDFFNSTDFWQLSGTKTVCYDPLF